MILKRLSVLLLSGGMVFSLAAAPKPEPPKPGEERPDDVICTFETPMGSHIKRKVCATRQAREEKTKADQDLLRRQSARGTGKGGPGAEPAGVTR
jgi:hypothetical protein